MKTIKFSTLAKKLGAFRCVDSLESRRGGNASNQFVVRFENGEIFQSYRTIIGVKLDGKVYLTSSYNCSMTTIYYTVQWLNMKISDIRTKISSGEFQMISEDW